jgi:hypothetical protein
MSAVVSVVASLVANVETVSRDSGRDWAHVALGWGVAIGMLVTYMVLLLRRGRALSAQVPADQRRWM